MWIAMNSAKLSPYGKNIKVEMNFKLENSKHSGEIIIHAHGEGAPRGSDQPTKYKADISFDHLEAGILFKHWINESEKSDEFKRIAVAIVEELVR